MERPDEYERAVKHWVLLEADERNKNALPPDLWVFSLRQSAIEGGVSFRFQSLATMELAVKDAMWHGHAGIDKWIGLVWTESKIDQNKIASDVASKLNQRRRPGESVESWHMDTLHLLEQYWRTTSVAYPPAIAVETLLTRLNFSPGSNAANKVLLCRAATVSAESTLLTEVNRAIESLYPLSSNYEHSELANPTFPPRRRTITGGSSSQSPAVRGPSRTFSTYNVRASVHRFVHLVHISDSTTKKGVNQEARFPKKKRSTPKQTGQTMLENWQPKSDARSCYDCLLPGHIAADCTTDKGQAAALRVILDWIASTHEAVLPKHGARSAVRAWYRTNGVDFGRHDTEVLSLMTAAANKAGLAVPKAGRPTVKCAVGRKTNPVCAVSSDDDSTSESSSTSSCYIDFSFTRVAEEATIVSAGLQKTSGDTHRRLHSMLDLGNPHVLAGAE
jgi:hypothetical protein